MSNFTKKLVAVMNEKVEPGKVFNALGHMCIGLGSAIGPESLRLSKYIDAGGGLHPYISEMPFIILKANSNKIRSLREAAIAAGIDFVDFTETMTDGGYQEQIERTRNTLSQELIYFGIVLFGDIDKVTELTKKFSLWK